MNQTETIASKRRARGPSPGRTAATRAALVEAALAAFLADGFAATRMDDVAARAGLGKGTIYLHFSDKAALFADVVREVVEGTVRGRRPPRPRPNEPTRDFLVRIVPPVLRDLERSGRFGVVRLVMSEGARFPVIASAYRRVAVEPLLRLVRVHARRARRRGELRSDALERAPILLVAPTVLAALGNGVFPDGAFDVEAAFQATLDALFEPDAVPAS